MVSENRTQNLLGLNLHEQLGIETVHREPTEVNFAEDVEEMDPTSRCWRDHFVKRYPNVFNRLLRLKNLNVFPNFKGPLIPGKLKAEKFPFTYKIESRPRLKN